HGLDPDPREPRQSRRDPDRSAAMTARVSATMSALPKLAGRVIRPDDADYDKARTSFYGGFDPRPGVIVRVANADDVSRLISFARESGTELIVRSGGHGVAGYAVPTGGIVLDLNEQHALELEAPTRPAPAETRPTARAQPHRPAK